ncbi:uncharacterized protein [Vulpes vulpes]|uniref:Uncharacterized protein n=1 Tax=Vulpes vulpes TaxID=9627 RepID=A0ABM4ZHS9_VULVU
MKEPLLSRQKSSACRGAPCPSPPPAAGPAPRVCEPACPPVPRADPPARGPAFPPEPRSAARTHLRGAPAFLPSSVGGQAPGEVGGPPRLPRAGFCVWSLPLAAGGSPGAPRETSGRWGRGLRAPGTRAGPASRRTRGGPRPQVPARGPASEGAEGAGIPQPTRASPGSARPRLEAENFRNLRNLRTQTGFTEHLLRAELCARPRGELEALATGPPQATPKCRWNWTGHTAWIKRRLEVMVVMVAKMILSGECLSPCEEQDTPLQKEIIVNGSERQSFTTQEDSSPLSRLQTGAGIPSVSPERYSQNHVPRKSGTYK